MKRESKRESADAGKKRRGHIDAPDPAVHGGIARSNRSNELDAAERENDAARSEVHADAGRRSWRVGFIQTRQTVVPLRNVPVDERSSVERENVEPEERGADPAGCCQCPSSPSDCLRAHPRRNERRRG